MLEPKEPSGVLRTTGEPSLLNTASRSDFSSRISVCGIGRPAFSRISFRYRITSYNVCYTKLLRLLTLLALVLAIGLVVDDAIVVLENIHRRMEEYGETPLVASYRGTRQVGFAVIATTLVLIAVFVPITFLEGDLGRLFTEFALTIAAAVAFFV